MGVCIMFMSSESADTVSQVFSPHALRHPRHTSRPHRISVITKKSGSKFKSHIHLARILSKHLDTHNIYIYILALNMRCGMERSRAG